MVAGAQAIEKSALELIRFCVRPSPAAAIAEQQIGNDNGDRRKNDLDKYRLALPVQQMSCFDQDDAALNAEWFVLAEVGASNPASLAVPAMLVRKNTFDHENLFASVMSVRVEICFWRPPHHGGVAGSKF